VGPAAVLVLGFLAAVLTGLQFPEVLNGSLVYAPAVIAITGVGVHHYRTRDRARLVLLAAAGILVIAVFFRVIDRAACAALPLGTHFLWHLLTACALYALGRALLAGVRRDRSRLNDRSTRPRLNSRTSEGEADAQLIVASQGAAV
jgi:hypothetical protein